MKSKNTLTNDPGSELVALVRNSKKYRAISEDLIRRIATQELEKNHNIRLAVKATRNKLHQIGGAYLDRAVDYNFCLDVLKRAFSVGNDEFLQACRQVMCYHSSTRERIPELDRFYRSILAGLPTARCVLDVACGLNPLAIPWMGLPDDVEYLAIDIYRDMVDFINRYMKLAGIKGSAVVGDVICNCPTKAVDIAFVLKTIPCLEQVDKTAGIELLNHLQAKNMIVSFRVHSLGGGG